MAIIRTYTIRYPVCVCLPMQKMCVHRHGCGSTSRLTLQTWQVSRANTLHSWLQSYYQHGQKKKGNKTHKLIKPGWLSLTLSQEEDHFPADTVGGPEKLSDPPVFMLGNPTPNATTSRRADSVLCFRVFARLLAWSLVSQPQRRMRWCSPLSSPSSLKTGGFLTGFLGWHSSTTV